MLETGKLYLTKAHTSANIGQTARLELHGVTSVIIFGSELDDSVLDDITDMTPATEELTEDFYYPLDTLPKYISFVGTVDSINTETVCLMSQLLRLGLGLRLRLRLFYCLTP